jgi:hypothetical protein
MHFKFLQFSIIAAYLLFLFHGTLRSSKHHCILNSIERIIQILTLFTTRCWLLLAFRCHELLLRRSLPVYICSFFFIFIYEHNIIYTNQITFNKIDIDITYHSILARLNFQVTLILRWRIANFRSEIYCA